MRNLKYILLFVFCIGILACGSATVVPQHGLPMAVPEDVGVSTEQLDEIAPVLQAYVDKGQLPGFLTVIARKGKIAHFEPLGMRDVENQKPVEPDTIFRIYSMSKPITSVAVMILYDEGYLKLDDPVEMYIPAFKDMKVYNKEQTETHAAKNKMTVKHLLTHTSGLTYGWGRKPVDKLYGELKIFKRGSGLTEMAEKLGEIPLVHEPGARWTYGVSTDVLGYLVEVVSEMPFEEFLQTKIFKPLGMVDTAFSVPKEKVERFAALYRHSKEDGMKLAANVPLANDDVSFFPSGGGGLVSTAADYLRFCQMLLNGGELEGVRILKTETVELMRYPHHQYGKNGAFGLGFHVVIRKDDDKNKRSTGAYSWSGAAATTFWIDPEKELIGILMTQLRNNPYSSLHGDFRKFTYQALIESEPEQSDNQEK
ncbi:MAG: serine hydrolase [Candidatus Poribacteria bacterium]|nr:serine hydrolase [Candidatus Poribacteria bacterium]